MATKNKKITIIKKDLEVDLPGLPNYLRIISIGSRAQDDESDITIPIQDLSDSELQQVGEVWTKALIESAKAKRVKHG